MLDIAISQNSQTLPIWGGGNSLNCLTSSLRFGALSTLDSCDGLFGGFLSLLFTGDRSSVAKSTAKYLRDIYGSDAYDFCWRQINVGSNKDLIDLVSSAKFEGAAILDVPSFNFIKYPAWHGNDVIDETHCIFVESREPGYVTISDPAVNVGANLFVLGIYEGSSPAFMYPMALHVFQLRKFLQLAHQVGSRYLFERKLRYARGSSLQGQLSIDTPASYTSIASRSDILSQIFFGGNLSLYRLHSLSLSDETFWSTFNLDKLHMANAICRDLSREVLIKMTRYLASTSTTSFRASQTHQIHSCVNHLNEALANFFDCVDAEIGL